MSCEAEKIKLTACGSKKSFDVQQKLYHFYSAAV